MKSPYLTKTEFRKETKGLHHKIDSSVKRLDEKIDASTQRLSQAILQNTERIERIEDTMATKDDIRLILDRIDFYTKRSDVMMKKLIVHDYRLEQLETKVFPHQ